MNVCVNIHKYSTYKTHTYSYLPYRTDSYTVFQDMYFVFSFFSVSHVFEMSDVMDLCACINTQSGITYRKHACTFSSTGWRRPIGCLQLQVIFRKRATNYRALMRKMTCKDKASNRSSPPCLSLVKYVSSILVLRFIFAKTR